MQALGLCAPGHAGWAVGCALGAVSLFFARFDSILFLSQFWGKCFKKKKRYIFKKKSNKIRQKFSKNKIFKNEIFENKIFVENNILNPKLIALHYL